ncbi:MAG: ribonuclease HI family protein [Candidatus Hydrothermarchaeaceae archaeon]
MINPSMKKIQFDGGAVPNPGAMGIGIVLLENDEVIAKFSEKLKDIGTNNIAEYTALLKGIKKALRLGWKDVTIEGDSKLVISQVTGSWKVNDENLKALHKKVKNALSHFDSYKFKKIPRARNSLADELASEALDDNKIPKRPKIIKSDEIIGTKCPKCKMECKFKWQRFKNGTKHIRMECPCHGFVKYAPKEEPFMTEANKYNEKV